VNRRHDLECNFPLTVDGVDESIAGLTDDPEPPFPLSEENLTRWRRMPLAKRRLAAEGPIEPGHIAARRAAMILAGECRRQGIPFDVAVHVCINIPFATGSTPRRRVTKQLARAARYGYYPQNGQTLLTGCCRDQRPRSTSGSLRQTFAPFCDGACAESCEALRAIRFPAIELDESEYAAIDQSNLFLHGGGLGRVGHDVWRRLAQLALRDDDRKVTATGSYLFHKLDGIYTERHVRAALRSLEKVELAALLHEEPQSRTWHIPALEHEKIAELEKRLGVHGKREANLREARNKKSDYEDWIHAELSRAGQEDELAAWDPPPAPVRL
jgi:hypothetical protein